MTGAEVISELITELDASVEAAAGFEGEMQRLSGYARCVNIIPSVLQLSSQQCHQHPCAFSRITLAMTGRERCLYPPRGYSLAAGRQNVLDGGVDGTRGDRASPAIHRCPFSQVGGYDRA